VRIGMKYFLYNSLIRR